MQFSMNNSIIYFQHLIITYTELLKKYDTTTYE